MSASSTSAVGLRTWEFVSSEITSTTRRERTRALADKYGSEIILEVIPPPDLFFSLLRFFLTTGI